MLCVIYENDCSYLPANPSPCPVPPALPCSVGPTTHPPPPLGKKTSLIYIRYHPINVHSLSVLSLQLAPPPPPHTHTQNFPGFGFFVKVHLLERLELQLYDLYFRSYS